MELESIHEIIPGPKLSYASLHSLHSEDRIKGVGQIILENLKNYCFMLLKMWNQYYTECVYIKFSLTDAVNDLELVPC